MFILLNMYNTTWLWEEIHENLFTSTAFACMVEFFLCFLGLGFNLFYLFVVTACLIAWLIL